MNPLKADCPVVYSAQPNLTTYMISQHFIQILKLDERGTMQSEK